MKSLKLTEKTIPVGLGIDMRENGQGSKSEEDRRFEERPTGTPAAVATVVYPDTGERGDAYDAEVTPTVKQ